MGIISRLLLLLYVFAVTAALIICAGVCLNFFPTEFWQGELNKIIARQETLAALAVMFLAGLCLIHSAFSSTGKKATEILSKDDVELQKGQAGEVKVTILAITGVVERAALTVAGVREVSAEVHSQSGDVPIKVRLNIVLGQGYSAPEVSAQINSAVNEALMTTLQISGVPVEIKVTEVTHAIVERERRVV